MHTIFIKHGYITGGTNVIKGVNRQMIEISNTGSPYFERALLVIQPGMDTAGEDALQAAAREMLKNADTCSHLRHNRRRVIAIRILNIVISGGIGAALALLLQWVL